MSVLRFRASADDPWIEIPTIIGGSTIEKLWVNPSPTSAFGAQKIDLANNAADFFLIDWVTNYADPWHMSPVLIHPGETGYMAFPSGPAGMGLGALMGWYRGITASTQTSITFNLAWSNGSTVLSNDNRICVPMTVYGVVLRGGKPTYEDSTDGNWTIRRWDNGTIETWYSNSHSFTMTSASGGTYISAGQTIYFPTGLFVNTPTATIQAYSSNGNVMGAGGLAVDSTKVQVFGRSATSQTQTLTVQIYAFGK